MTDLERVKQTLARFVLALGADWGDTDLGNEAAAAKAIIDAHLKEDAKIRRGYRAREVEANTRRNAAEAELTELRGVLRRAVRWVRMDDPGETWEVIAKDAQPLIQEKE